jgi:hypothetical protein
VTDEPFVELEELHAEPSLFPPLISSNEPSPSYVFSHTPPPTPLGRSTATFRWPGSLQHQGPPSLPGLYDLVAWLLPYLDPTSTAKLAVLNTTFSLGPTAYPIYLYRPWSPLRRRRWGFGIPSTSRSSTSDFPTVEMGFHLAWTYLRPADRANVVLAYPTMVPYVELRQFAASIQSVSTLRHIRPPPGKPTILDPHRALLYSAALLRFNFIYGDFVRWLSGKCTNRHRKWSSVYNTFTTRRARPAPANLPPVDFARGFRIATTKASLWKAILSAPFTRLALVIAMIITQQILPINPL